MNNLMNDLIKKEMRMKRRSTTVLTTTALLFAGLMIPRGNAQQNSGPVKAVQLTGLTGVKGNAKGTLSVENGQLHFVRGKETSDVSATTMEDVVTGADSQEAVGKTIGIMSMAAPYGGGRFLSLFRTKIDTLTIRYCDVDGGLHGAIFTMPVGTADAIKKELVVQGAHTSATGDPNAPPASSTKSPSRKQK
jgi:hypothetical protein